MFRIVPVLTLLAAAVGGVLSGYAQPTSLTAQSSVCRFGTTVLCEVQEVCTEKAFNFNLKNFAFGFGPCLSKTQYHLYYTRKAMGDGNPTGGSAKPTGDDGPGGDSGDGSAA